MKNRINLAIVGSVITLAVLGCGGSNSSTSSPANVATAPAGNNAQATGETETPIAVQAKALTKEYDENELAADGKYKGKLLTVSGKVGRVAETFGSVSVALDGHNMVVDVLCSFEDSERETVGKIKKGQQVKLTGTGDGMTAGLYVGLQKCRVG